MKNIEYREKKIFTNDGRSLKERDALVSEHILDVIVGGVQVVRLICTNTDLKELAAGRLRSEGIITSAADISKMELSPDETQIRIELTKGVDWEEPQSPEPTACASNKVYASAKKSLKALPEIKWETGWVFALADRFAEGVNIYNSTQGTHSSFLAKDGKVIFACEDMGRHNAVDKAIGFAVLGGVDLSECVLFTSGRVPVDMVEKVIAAGIPMLVSKSVPTSQSVELARKYGLTLICRAWPESFEIFNPIS